MTGRSGSEGVDELDGVPANSRSGVLSVNKRILARHFSACASRYDAVATVQRQMAEELCADLAVAVPWARHAPARRASAQCPSARRPSAPDPSALRILEIGCGTGLLTERLADTFPEAHIVAVDLAPGMLEVARRRLAGRPVTFVCADAEALELSERFDVIASSATFQWLAYPQESLRRLASHLRRGGVLAANLFVEGTLQELFAAFRLAEEALGVPAAPHGPDLLPAQAWKQFLVQAGLSVEVAAVSEVVQRYPSARALLHAVKALGANNAAGAAVRPAVVREMLRVYEERFRDGAAVRATFRTLLVRGRA